MADKIHILLLAGTFEARNLAASLQRRFPAVRLTASLAGAVSDTSDLGTATRIGGFGGVAGLADYILRERVRLVIDATHPFAAQISTHAVEAATIAGVQLIRLERPVWKEEPGDNWQRTGSTAQAAEMLPAGARAFLAIGRKEIDAFAHREDIFALVRMIEPPALPLPSGWVLELGRPSQNVNEERALMTANRITHLVSKNSGGSRSYAKIPAARDLGVTVVLVDRPRVPAAPTAGSETDLLNAVERRIAQFEAS